MPAVQNLTGQSHPVPYTGRSKNSAKIIQYLYDGVYEHKIGSVSREIYLSDLSRIANVKNRKIFQGIIEEKYNDLEYVINSYKKSEFAITRLLTKSYVERKLYNPSFHVTDTENKNSSALDIRTHEPYTDTAEGFYDKHWALGYGGYRGSDHNHMTYRKRPIVNKD